MQIHGLDRDNLAEARRWEALTRTAAARLPPGAPHLDDIDLVAASLSEHFGASADALARLEETIARLERTLGPEHPTVGRLLHNASNSAYALGQADRAHALLDRGIGILEEALGADHPQVWIARLAQASRDDNSLARSDAAFESHQRRVVEQFELGLARLEDAYGPEALVVAMTLDNMANAVSRTDPRRALEIGERSQAIWLATRGIDDPDVAHNVSNQGTRLHYLGRHREAADAQERALATLEAVRGGSHPDVREVLERLAISCIELGEHARARRALLRALEIPAAPDSGAPPRLLKWLARAELGLGNREAAAAAATRARDLLDPKEDAEARADIDAWLRARRLSSAHARRSAAR
jgi:hypothetical protein